MDQIVPVNSNKLDNKDFTGAMRIVRYFEETDLNYRKVARALDPENSASMIAVFRSDRWEKADVRRWERVIKKHQAIINQTRAEKAKAGTEIVKKEKKKHLK